MCQYYDIIMLLFCTLFSDGVEINAVNDDDHVLRSMNVRQVP